jgi:hypothetical protein
MKYLFRPTARNATHRRLADDVTGILRSFADTVTIEPASAQVEPEGYELIPLAPAPVEPALPRSASGATIIRRLTDAEVLALNGSVHPAAVRAKMLAMSEGLVSEADPDFAALTAALDGLGIIAAARWNELLAP